MKTTTLSVESRTRREILDLTDRVQESIPADANGICVLFLMHTTAALTLAALQDGAGEDLIETLPKLVPAVSFRHEPPEHVPAHVLSAIIGANVSVPVRNGCLQLGGVQRIVLLEFEGPATRQVEITLV